MRPKRSKQQIKYHMSDSELDVTDNESERSDDDFSIDDDNDCNILPFLI